MIIFTRKRDPFKAEKFHVTKNGISFGRTFRKYYFQLRKTIGKKFNEPLPSSRIPRMDGRGINKFKCTIRNKVRNCSELIFVESRSLILFLQRENISFGKSLWTNAKVFRFVSNRKKKKKSLMRPVM